MKGGAVRHPDNFQEVRVNEEIEVEPENNNMELLSALGFEEGELEMFFDMVQGMVNENQLVQKYLEIAQRDPYNLNWTTSQMAANSNYDTGILKPNGTSYTKHDIANDTLNSFYEIISINGGRNNKKHKKRVTRKNKRSRKSKKSRKNRKSRHSRR